MSLQKRIERLEVEQTEEPWLVYSLHDWAPGAPRAFEVDTPAAEMGRYEQLALDALVAAGKITEGDRGRVTLIVRQLVEPQHDGDISLTTAKN